MADDSEQKASPRENIGDGGKNVFRDPFYYRGEKPSHHLLFATVKKPPIRHILLIPLACRGLRRIA